MLLNRKLALVAFCGCLLTLFFGAVSHRPMFVDGAFWYYNALNYRSPFYDDHYVRLFDTLLQWPAVFLMRAWPETGHRFAVALLDLAYSLHPVLSLAACAIILRRRDKLEYLVFPLLSFATATMSTLPFAVGIVPDALSVFWPLFCINLFRATGSKPAALGDLLATFLLSVALALTYEGSMLFFGLLGLMAVTKFAHSRGRRQGWPEHALVAVIFALGICWTVYRVLGPTAGTAANFLTSIQRAPGSFTIYSAALIVSFLGTLLLRRPRIMLGCFLVAALGFFMQEKPTMWATFDARTTAIPLATLVAAGAFIYSEGTKRRSWKPGFLNGAPLLLATGALLVAAIHDFEITRQWRTGIRYVQTVIEENKGCVNMSRDDYETRAAGQGIADWSLPYLSIVLQKNRQISTVVFTPQAAALTKGRNPCNGLKSGMLTSDFDFTLPIKLSRSFDYSAIQ